MNARITQPAEPVPFFLTDSVSDAVDEVLNEDAADAAQLTKLAQTRAFLVGQINELDAMAITVATKRQTRGLPSTPASAPLPAAPVPAATPAPAPAAASTPVTPTPAPAPAEATPAVPVAAATPAPAAASPASDPAPATPATSATPAPATAATAVLPDPAPAGSTGRSARGVLGWIQNRGGALIGFGIAVLGSFLLLLVALWVISMAPQVFGALFAIWVLVTLILIGLGLFIGERRHHPVAHVEPPTPSV